MKLKESFDKVSEYFSPHIIASLNDHYVKVVKILGDKVPWHNHEDEDELFYIVEGNLLMEIEDQPASILQSGDLFIVPKGVYHRVSSAEECSVMLIEPMNTEHTGKVQSAITKSIDDQKKYSG